MAWAWHGHCGEKAKESSKYQRIVEMGGCATKSGDLTGCKNEHQNNINNK